jgi:hypothetical protein
MVFPADLISIVSKAYAGASPASEALGAQAKDLETGTLARLAEPAPGGTLRVSELQAYHRPEVVALANGLRRAGVRELTFPDDALAVEVRLFATLLRESIRGGPGYLSERLADCRTRVRVVLDNLHEGSATTLPLALEVEPASEGDPDPAAEGDPEDPPPQEEPLLPPLEAFPDPEGLDGAEDVPDPVPPLEIGVGEWDEAREGEEETGWEPGDPPAFEDGVPGARAGELRQVWDEYRPHVDDPESRAWEVVSASLWESSPEGDRDEVPPAPWSDGDFDDVQTFQTQEEGSEGSVPESRWDSVDLASAPMGLAEDWEPACEEKPGGGSMDFEPSVVEAGAEAAEPARGSPVREGSSEDVSLAMPEDTDIEAPFLSSEDPTSPVGIEDLAPDWGRLPALKDPYTGHNGGRVPGHAAGVGSAPASHQEEPLTAEEEREPATLPGPFDASEEEREPATLHGPFDASEEEAVAPAGGWMTPGGSSLEKELPCELEPLDLGPPDRAGPGSAVPQVPSAEALSDSCGLSGHGEGWPRGEVWPELDEPGLKEDEIAEEPAGDPVSRADMTLWPPGMEDVLEHTTGGESFDRPLLQQSEGDTSDDFDSPLSDEDKEAGDESARPMGSDELSWTPASSPVELARAYIVARSEGREAITRAIGSWVAEHTESETAEELADAVEILALGGSASGTAPGLDLAISLTTPAVARCLVSRLGSEGDAVHRALYRDIAMRLMAEMGPAIVEALGEAEDRGVRLFLQEAVIGLGEPGWQLARSMAGDERWHVARNGVALLGGIGGQ